jgi:hypothetical protein
MSGMAGSELHFRRRPRPWLGLEIGVVAREPGMDATMLLGNSSIDVLYRCSTSLYFRRSTAMRFSVPAISSCNRRKFSLERNCG